VNYTVYHLHSDLSLLDSATKYQDYIDRAAELGQTAICFTEHGNIFNWIAKKQYCEEKGLKYLHGVEIYLTETHDAKVRDNYHTILIARNFAGFLELNRLVDMSSQADHKYYKDRISFDEFLKISGNIIKISACMASPLNKLPADNPHYERLLRHYDYYEVQPHINSYEQIEYNKRLYALSQQYGKPLIAGTDTHSLDKYKAECRTILQVAKNIVFSNEDEFDLTYKRYNEVVEMFRAQGALPEDVFLQAIENTNVMADSVESFELDLSFKYPKLYEDEEAVYLERINRMYKQKLANGVIQDNPRYAEDIKEEFAVFKKLGMIGFMLFMAEMAEWCEENGIPKGPCRGSVGGSTVAYLTDVTDVDPFVWGTVFSRFCNEDRLEIGDVDVDHAPDDREKVYEYIINRFGKDNTAYILTTGTIAEKGTIDEIGRAFHYYWKKENEGKKETESPYHIDRMARIKAEFESDTEETRQKYEEIFYYFDGLLGVVISQGIHPAGMVASPVTLPDNYGTFWSGEKRVTSINMEEIHEVSLVKYDILGLKNIGVIRDTCKLAGLPYPKSHTIDWNDSAVWEDVIKSPAGLFQFESPFAFDSLKKFEPRKINDMSLVNAAIRPSGASYRDRLFAKQVNKNPSEIIDEVLKDNDGYLCIGENEDICTPTGPVKIKNILVGDSVYTHNGIRRVKGKFDNGVQDVYALRFLGREIKLTNAHKVLTHKGWLPLSQISVGDSVAYHLGNQSKITHNESLLMLVGWLLGDGGLTVSNCIKFTNQSYDVTLAFRRAVEAFDPSLTTSITNRTSRVNKLDLFLSEVRFVKNSKKAKSLTLKLRELGLKYDEGGGCAATEKFIPDFLFGLSKESLLIFLGAYTDTDSNLPNISTPYLTYKTASSRLAYGLQEIIRLIGYSANVSKAENAYHIGVNSARGLLLELHQHSYKVRRRWEVDRLTKSNKIIYGGRVLRQYVIDWVVENKLCKKDVWRNTGVQLCAKHKYIAASAVERIALYYSLSYPFDINRNTEWVVVDEICYQGASNVFDIEVEDVHNYVCNGVVVHNCFQEDTIKFLKDICGLSGSEADNVRRAIGRKDEERLNAALPQILDGYCGMSDKPREVAEAEAKEFIQIIEDSSRYQFGLNHSTGYSMIAYMCAMLRYYYPLEFVTALLNNADNESDIISGTELAQMKKIKIKPIQFGYSRAKYMADKETNSVYKGIESIKYCNTAIGEELYRMRNKLYESFMELLYDINAIDINSRQMDILIKLDYFRVFGNSKYLLKLRDIFDYFKQGSAKHLKKDKVNDPILKSIIERHSRQTEKTYLDLDTRSILYEVEQYMSAQDIRDFSLKDKIAFQKEFLGYIDIQTNNPEDKNKLLVVSVTPLKNKNKSKVWGYRYKTVALATGKNSEITIWASDYASRPVQELDTIFVKREWLEKKEWNGYINIWANNYRIIESGVA